MLHFPSFNMFKKKGIRRMTTPLGGKEMVEKSIHRELCVVLRIWIHVALQTRHLCRSFPQISSVCTYEKIQNTYTCPWTTSFSDIIITHPLTCEKEGFRQIPTLSQWKKEKERKIKQHCALLCAFIFSKHQCLGFSPVEWLLHGTYTICSCY